MWYHEIIVLSSTGILILNISRMMNVEIIKDTKKNFFFSLDIIFYSRKNIVKKSVVLILL